MKVTPDYQRKRLAAIKAGTWRPWGREVKPRTSRSWFVVMRGGTPVAAFPIAALAHEFINAEPYRRRDRIEEMEISITALQPDSTGNCKDTPSDS